MCPGSIIHLDPERFIRLPQAVVELLTRTLCFLSSGRRSDGVHRLRRLDQFFRSGKEEDPAKKPVAWNRLSLHDKLRSCLAHVVLDFIFALTVGDLGLVPAERTGNETDGPS